jgi:hypothetical protein
MYKPVKTLKLDKIIILLVNRGSTFARAKHVLIEAFKILGPKAHKLILKNQF